MKKSNLILELLKGAAISFGITVIGVAGIALLAKDMESSFLSVASVVIKILSIVIGTLVCGRKIRKRGAIVGILTATVYWSLCIVLSFVVNPEQISLNILADLLFSLLVGVFAGILTVNTIK